MSDARLILPSEYEVEFASTAGTVANIMPAKPFGYELQIIKSQACSYL